LSLKRSDAVITGYNTDVKHNSRVFHIQTEDKGAGNPCIESLIYVGGEILAAKKTSYAEVIRGGRDDQAIQELMEQQHRSMIAAIQRGRFDGPNGSLQVPEGMGVSAPAPPPPAPPVRVDGARVSGDRTLDQVILEYLASELTEEPFDVTLTPAPAFLAGRPVQAKLRAESSLSRQPIAGATVQVRILSTVARSTTVFQGKTASDGSCQLSFQIPAFSEGEAAAVIRVTASSGNAELKYPVKRKA
jgi:hypothetical protein